MPWKVREGLDTKQRVWRYLTIAAFLDILQRKALFFPTIALLKSLDSWEGHVPTSEVSLPLRGSAGDLLGVLQVQTQESEARRKRAERQVPRQLVSCWHANAVESVAMWRLYAERQGVALSTTVGALRDALDPELNGFIAEVFYMDRPDTYERQADVDPTFPQIALALTSAFCYLAADPDVRHVLVKRRCYAHEHEIRAFASDATLNNDAGRHVKLDFQKLNPEVWVSPVAEEWVSEVITNEVRLHGLPANVLKSRISKLPR